MTIYSDTLRDENSAPISGATVYVYDADGALGTLTDSLGNPIANPISTDQFGYYAFQATDGRKTLDIWLGAVRRWREVIIVGASTEEEIADAKTASIAAADRADAAAARVEAVMFITPVDEIGGALPALAYGTRKMVSSYNGPAIRVRRASDSIEIDIGFNGGVLDAGALDAFIAGTTGFVRTYYDQTGRGHHATQTTAASQPKINARDFRGARGVDFLPGGTFPLPTLATTRRALTVLAATSMDMLDTNGLIEFSGPYYFFQQDFVRTSTYSGPLSNYHLSIMGLRGSAGATRLFSDEATSDFAAEAATAITGGTLGRLPTAGYNFAGRLAGLIIYERSLSDLELADGRAAMHTAFRVSATKTGRIWGFGDSILAGSYSGGDGSPLLGAMNALNGYRLSNFAVGGTTSGDASARYTSYRATVQANPGIVVQNSGTNDLTVNADSGAVIYARLQALWAMAKADGNQVIACTIMPRTGLTGPQETRRTDLNTLIRGSVAGGFTDAVCDLDAITAFVGNPVRYFADGLHLTLEGEQVAADVLAPIILAL